MLGAAAIGGLGTERQKAEWLPQLAEGKVRIAFALTEPESGSDASALRTTATRSENGFVVNGQKVFVTGAAVADLIIVVVRTDSSAADRREGLSLLMIDAKASGLSVRRLSKLGLKPLDLCEVFFADVEVPAERLLGPLGRGWSSLRPQLTLERAEERFQSVHVAAMLGDAEVTLRLLSSAWAHVAWDESAVWKKEAKQKLR